MGLKSSSSKYNGDKLQVIHSSELANSQVKFLSAQKSSHSYFMNTTVSYKNHEYQTQEYVDTLIKAGKMIDTTNLYMPLGWQRHQGQICEQIKDLELYYPIYNYWLRNEIQARKSTQQSFTELQIWYMLMSILNALKQFQKISLVSTPLGVDNVRMNEQGLIKIQNSLSSPKLYEQVIQQKRNNRGSPTNSQIKQTYNLGLLLLQICTFQYIDFPSQAHETTLNQFQTGRYIKAMSMHYSELLCTLVNVMLSSYTDRPLPSQIYQIFVPFKREIMSLKPFNFSVNMMRNSMMSQSHMTAPNRALSMYMSKQPQILQNNIQHNQQRNQRNLGNNNYSNMQPSSNSRNIQNPSLSPYYTYQGERNLPVHESNYNMQNSSQYYSPISYQNKSRTFYK